MEDQQLRRLLVRCPPAARDVLRRAARAEPGERDGLAHRLLREPEGADMAEFIDQMTLNPNLRRQVGRLLAEIEAGG